MAATYIRSEVQSQQDSQWQWRAASEQYIRYTRTMYTTTYTVRGTVYDDVEEQAEELAAASATPGRSTENGTITYALSAPWWEAKVVKREWTEWSTTN